MWNVTAFPTPPPDVDDDGEAEAEDDRLCHSKSGDVDGGEIADLCDEVGVEVINVCC